MSNTSAKTPIPALWQEGKNAGAALMKAASQLTQGEYAPGVTFNIGMVEIGDARNKVPGLAWLKAELRSFDRSKSRPHRRENPASFQDHSRPDGHDRQNLPRHLY